MWADPEIEWVIAAEHPESRTLKGYEAIEDYLNEWESTLPGMRFVPEEVLDAGERILAIGSVSGTGAGSGAGVEVPIAFLCSLSGAKVIRVEEYLDPKQALRQAGLA